LIPMSGLPSNTDDGPGATVTNTGAPYGALR
jgi:hypothetical protein